MEFFKTTLIQDYLSERLGITGQVSKVMPNYSGGYLLVYIEGSSDYEKIYFLLLMDFIYSKIQSQETESPEPVV